LRENGILPIVESTAARIGRFASSELTLPLLRGVAALFLWLAGVYLEGASHKQVWCEWLDLVIRNRTMSIDLDNLEPLFHAFEARVGVGDLALEPEGVRS
jgi:hypothetical protein